MNCIYVIVTSVKNNCNVFLLQCHVLRQFILPQTGKESCVREEVQY